MVDFIKSIFESWSERIRSPFLSSFTVVFLALNWKGLFVLFFAKMPVVERIAYFEGHSSDLTLLAYPSLGGLILPFIFETMKLASAWTISWPEEKIHHMRSSRSLGRRVQAYVDGKNEEVEKLKADAKHEEALAEFRAQKERALLEQAERDRQAEILGPNVKDSLKLLRFSDEVSRKITELRGNHIARGIDNDPQGEFVSPLAIALLEILSVKGSSFSVPDVVLDALSVDQKHRLYGVIFPEHPVGELEYDAFAIMLSAAFDELLRNNFVEVEGGGSQFPPTYRVTDLGYARIANEASKI